jgi:hypothetical protein
LGVAAGVVAAVGAVGGVPTIPPVMPPGGTVIPGVPESGLEVPPSELSVLLTGEAPVARPVLIVAAGVLVCGGVLTVPG